MASPKFPTQRFDQAEAAFGDGVIGSTLVIDQRYLLGKGRWHRITVAGDMANLTRGEPKFK